MLDLIITFICAAFFGIPIEGVVFWIVLFVQRMYIGGYHAKTRLRCLFISWIVTIISFWIIKMDMSDRVLLYMMGVVTVSFAPFLIAVSKRSKPKIAHTVHMPE